MSCLITMSQRELHRLEVIQKIRQGSMTVVQAAELLGRSRSQVHRLLQAYGQAGADGLVSKKRGRPSNRRHSEDFRNAALDLIRDRYADFGPTLAREKLIELHHLSIAKETLRPIWQANRVLQRQAWHLPHDPCVQEGQNQRPDAIRAGAL
jgi:transposase